MRKVIGGVFVLGAVLLGLLAAVTFFFKVGSWHGGSYMLIPLASFIGEAIGTAACVVAARA